MTTLTAPLFPIGSEFRVDRYVGVVRVDHSHPAPLHEVTGIRAVAEEGEDEVGRFLACPKGWEYMLANVQSGSEWGWVPEADILTAGYAPPNQTEAA